MSTPVSSEHVHEVLEAEVAAGTRCERATSQTADRSVDPRRAGVERHERVGDPEAARVVQVHTDRPITGEATVAAPTSDATSDGIAVPMVSASDTPAAPAASTRSAIASTSPVATGPSYGHPNAVASVTSSAVRIGQAGGDRLHLGERGIGGATGVVDAVRLRHAHHELQSVHPGGESPLDATSVQHERPPLDVAASRRGQLLGVGHRRHAVGSHERGELEVAHAGAHQRIEHGDLVDGGDGRLVLQPVAHRDVAAA